MSDIHAAPHQAPTIPADGTAPTPEAAPAPPPAAPGTWPDAGAPVPSAAPSVSGPLPSIPPEYTALPASRAVRAGQGYQVPARPKVTPLLGAHLPQETVLVQRAWTGQRISADQRRLSRRRKIAGDLPEWNPMPPDELTIARHVASPST